MAVTLYRQVGKSNPSRQLASNRLSWRFSKGRDFGPRATDDVKLKVVALHLVHQVIA